MNTSIIPYSPAIRKRSDVRIGKADAGVDPCRRLVGAVVLQAVEDAFFPNKVTTPEDRASAIEFLGSEDGQYMLGRVLGKAVD